MPFFPKGEAGSTPAARSNSPVRTGNSGVRLPPWINTHRCGCGPNLPKHPCPRHTANMPTPEDQLKAMKLRLQTQLENIAFALENATLSEEQRALLKAQLASVQNELLRLTGDTSLN